MTTPLPIHALVVDDNQDNRLLMKLGLTQAGYEVTEAKDGLDGLDKIKTRSFHLLILDLQMPRLNGLEVLRQLRKDKAYDHLHIVVATANPHLAVTDDLYEYADFVLQKPLDLMAFIQLAQRVKATSRVVL